MIIVIIVSSEFRLAFVGLGPLKFRPFASNACSRHCGDVCFWKLLSSDMVPSLQPLDICRTAFDSNASLSGSSHSDAFDQAVRRICCVVNERSARLERMAAAGLQANEAGHVASFFGWCHLRVDELPICQLKVITT